MGDKRGRGKRLSMTPEEILARAFHFKCKFRAIVRLAIANLYWLDDVEDEELGDDVQKNVILLTRKKEKKGLSILDKSILCKPNSERTDKEKAHLNRVIGGLKCFRRYPSHVKAQLAAVTSFVYYGPDRTIVRQGDPGLALYFIITGEAIVQQLAYDPIEETNTYQEVARRGPGGMFGEVSLLHGVPRTATIVTSTHCELLKLKKEDFDVVLKATVQEEWDNIREAMTMFSYFQNWDEIAKRECCILSKIHKFQVDETILGDSVGLTDYVYFVIQGTCRIIHHLTVIPYFRGGKKFYKLYETNVDTSNDSSGDDGGHSRMTLSTVDIEDENRESKSVQTSMKIAEQLSTANLPPEVEVYFMQICFLHTTACFGLEEVFEHKRIVASTEVQCLLIPRYWLYQKNVGNIWNRIVQYLNAHIPSTKEVFEMFINNRKWLKHRKSLLSDILAAKQSGSHALFSDIPLYIRLHESERYD